MDKQKSIPQIRFQECTGNWYCTEYKNVYSFRTTNSFSREKLNYDKGEVKNIHYGDIHTKFRTLFDVQRESVPYLNSDINIDKISFDNYCKEGDLIIADASEDYADIGKAIEIVNLNNEKVVGGLHTFLARPDLSKISIGFGGYLMKSSSIRLQLKIIAQGTKVLSISTGRLSDIKFNLPSLPEQQKIATFLSTVDEKIQALKKKKSLLEQYKKGVMQQIFNQEIRFKDDDGIDYPDWEEKKVGDIVIFTNGKAHENEIDKDGLYVVVNSKFISTNGKVRKYSDKNISPLLKNDIVLVMSDVPNGKTLGKCFLIDRDNKYTLNQRICSLREVNVYNPFLFYIINRNDYYLSFDSGVGQTNLKKEDVLNCPIVIPISKEEQIKIANFLSAIDDKIVYCQNHIDKSELWKKGLLQQMFV